VVINFVTPTGGGTILLIDVPGQWYMSSIIFFSNAKITGNLREGGFPCPRDTV
jgi:hypothetical protein